MPQRIEWYPSISLEALGSKLPTDSFHHFAGRRLDVSELVIELELVPLEPTHLMEGQHVDSFHVTQTGGESCYPGNVLCTVGQAWHRHEAHPNRSLKSSEAAREIEDRTNLHAGHPAVEFRVPAL